MKQKILTSKNLIALLGLSLLTACAGNKKNESSYKTQSAETTSYLEQYNTLLVQNQKSDANLRETARLMQELDGTAVDCRAAVQKARANLRTSDAAVLKADLEQVEVQVKNALATIGRIESQFSKANTNQMVSNAPALFKENSVENMQAIIKLQGLALSSLSGLRDIFLGSYNDLVGEANVRLSVLHATPHVVNLRANPVVSDLSQGGRISGAVKDSVTGRPITGAFVGFKTLRESRDYFYETTTDSSGRYESPNVAAGDYFMDIKQDGYVLADSQLVRATTGVVNSGNTVSLTTPLAEGEFRIVLTWTNASAGAVSDVDSYLLIPGVASPLNFNLKGRVYNGAYLDRDDTDWEGPETTTIHQVRTGSYRYYVNNFNRRGDRAALGNSKVRITVYKGSVMIRQYNVPTGDGLSYEVFRIENGSLVDVEVFDSRNALPVSSL